MRALRSAQHIVVPVALTISALIYVWSANFHSVHMTSPVFARRGQVEHWASRLEQARNCHKSSVQLLLISESDGRFGRQRGPWFGTLSCNTARLWLRYAAILILPWLMMNLALAMLARLDPPVRSKRR